PIECGLPSPDLITSHQVRSCHPVSHYSGPLFARPAAEALLAARDADAGAWTGSLDLGRSIDNVTVEADVWRWRGRSYPYPHGLKERTIYYWDGDGFAPVARFAGSLIKLVPTGWGAPTFEIDGIKMLPTSKESPLEDATQGGAGRATRQAGARYLRRSRLFRRLLPGGRRGAHPVVREECRCAVVAHAQSVVTGPRRQRWPAAIATCRRVAGDRADRRRLDRRAAARPAAFRHRRRAVLAGVLRTARAGAASRRTTFPLHRKPEQADQWPRRAARSGEASRESRLQGAACAGRRAGRAALNGRWEQRLKDPRLPRA